MPNELTTTETMGFLERATRDPSLDVAKIEQLIALQERLLDREAKRQFVEAMNALQSEMPQVTKDRANPHTRSRYATYESVDKILRPYYSQHGFSVQFNTSAKDGRIRVGCTVSHVGGHSQSNELESGPDVAGARGTANKSEVQGVGSIVTYLKRYTLMAAFAVAVQDDETDDDGNGNYAPPPPPPNPTLRRAGPPTNGSQSPQDPPAQEPPKRDPYDTWLDTMDIKAAELTAEGWDGFWTRPSILKADAELQGEQLARMRAIQAREKARLFPTTDGADTEEETL